MILRGKLAFLSVVLVILLSVGLGLHGGSPAAVATSGSLQNPGFEDGLLYWTVVEPIPDAVAVVGPEGPNEFPTYADMGNITVSPYKGDYMLRLGNPKSISEKQASGENTVYQLFTSNRSNLKFSFRLFSWEPRNCDLFSFDLQYAESLESVEEAAIRMVDDSPFVIDMPDGSQECEILPCRFTIDVGKRGQYLDTGWVEVEIYDIPLGQELVLTYSVGGTKNNAHATWAYFDNVNTPPVARFTFSPEYPAEGDIVELIDESYDTDPDDAIASWLWDVQWSDGNETWEVSSTSQSPFFIPHDESGEGEYYNVSLTVTDLNGTSTTVSSGGIATDGTAVLPVIVENAAPKVNALNIEVLASETGTLIGRFLDTGWLDTHTATWSLDDGSSPAVATFEEDNGAFVGTGRVTGEVTVPADVGGTLTVEDNDGLSGSDSFQVTVVPDDPTNSREPNNTLDTAPQLASDGIYLSYIQSEGDIDLYKVVLPGGESLPTGAELLVTLKDLPADYDLIILTQPSGQSTAPFSASPFQASPFSASPFSASPFSASPFSASPFSASPFSASPFSASPFSASGIMRSPFSASPFNASPFSASPFSASPFSASPFSASPLSQMGFTGLEGDEIGGTDIALSELGLSSIEGENLQTMGFSANRGLDEEVLLARCEVAGTQFFVAIVGANGAYSAEPYSLQLEISEPLDLVEILSQAGFTYDAPVTNYTPGDFVLYDCLDPKTLFVTQQERLIGLYGDTEWNGLLADLKSLADHINIRGRIISIPGNIYQSWDENPTSIDAANEVVAQIRNAIQDELTADPSIQYQYVVLVGSDDVIPFRRVPDETIISNERSYLMSSFLKPGSPLFFSMLEGFNLTDDYYVDAAAVPWQGRSLYIPDLPIARLVETPEEISMVVNAFIGSDGILTPETALVTGYDFFIDGAQAIADTMNSAALLTDDTLINDDWSADDLRSSFLSQSHDISTVNAHFTHYAALAALGFTTDDYSDILISDEIDAVTDSLLQNSIIFSMGCHAGLNVPDQAGPEAADFGLGVNPKLDFPQAMARQGAIYLASTGYGLGDDAGIGGTERLIGIFTEEILKNNADDITVGDALIAAKQRYLTSLSAMTVYDEKSSIQFTLYGLPQYRVQPTGYDADIQPSGDLFGTLNLTIDGIPSSYDLYEVVTADGSYYNAEGDAQATAGRAVQPRVVESIPSDTNGSAHGVLLTSSEFTDLTDFNPVIARPTNEWEQNTEEFQIGFRSFWPSELATITNLETEGELIQTLVVLPGQFRCTSAPNMTVTGIQRLYSDLTFELLRSTLDNDYEPAVVSSIDLSIDGTTTTVTVAASDLNGIARIVILQFDEDAGQTSVAADFTPGDPSADEFTIPIEELGDDTLIIQVVDGASNIASATGKGANMSAIEISAESAVTVDENSQVTLQATLPGFANLTPPVFYIWEFADGYFASGETTDGTITVEHTYPDDNPSSGTPSDDFVTTLKVTDSNGGIGNAVTVVTVEDVAPKVFIESAKSPIDENDESTVTGSFTDVCSLDTHTATIDWGDGTGVVDLPIEQYAGYGTFTASHQYLDDDPSGTTQDKYKVTVTVTDDDTVSGTATTLVTVNNLAPTVEAGADKTVNEGEKVSLDPAEFSDIGTLDTHNNVNTTINWGDGIISDGVVDEVDGCGTVSGNHVYADDGTYAVTVTVTDDDGGVGSDILTVTVNNLAPTVEAGADKTVNEGEVVSLAPSLFNDMGTLDTHNNVNTTINWGDGTAPDAGVVDESPFGPPGSTAGADGTVSDSHVYADNGIYEVTVTVTDDDLGAGSDTLVVTVNNVAPTVEAGADQMEVYYGEVVSLDPAIFNDLGTLDTHTATIDWGDGTAPDDGVVAESPFGPPGSTVGASGTVSGSHVYADNGDYTVTVTVTDDDSGVTSDTLKVIVQQRWEDPEGDVGDTDEDLSNGDIISGDAYNDNITMTIILRVAGTISDQFQYRVKLVADSGSYHLKYDDGKVTGLPNLEVFADGNELRFTFELSSIGLESGDHVQVSMETQGGVPAESGVGIADNMPDSGTFSYFLY